MQKNKDKITRDYEKAYDKYEDEFKDIYEEGNHQFLFSEDRMRYKQMVQDVNLGRMDPPVAYDDGDQSPVSGKDAPILHAKWGLYHDYCPFRCRWLSELCMNLWGGKYDKVMEILENKTDEEIEMLMKKRESFALTGVLTHVVQGAKIFS